MSKFFTLEFFIALILFLTGSFSIAKEKPRALVIAFYDYTLAPAIIDEEIRHLSEVLGDQTEIVLATGKDGDSWGSNYTRLKTERKNIIAQLESLQGSFSHLVLITHGSFGNDPAKGSYTSLRGIGRLYETEADSQAKDFFAPLRAHLKKNANVYTVSCKNFCGTDSQIQKRAEVMMTTLGATEGKLYGSSTYDLAIVSPSSPQFEELLRQRERYTTRGSFLNISLYLIFALAPQIFTYLASFAIDYIYNFHTVTATLTTFMASPFEFLGIYLWHNGLARHIGAKSLDLTQNDFLDKTKEVKGLLMSFQHGKVKKMQPSNRWADFHEIVDGNYYRTLNTEQSLRCAHALTLPLTQ